MPSLRMVRITTIVLVIGCMFLASTLVAMNQLAGHVEGAGGGGSATRSFNLPFASLRGGARGTGRRLPSATDAAHPRRQWGDANGAYVESLEEIVDLLKEFLRRVHVAFSAIGGSDIDNMVARAWECYREIVTELLVPFDERFKGSLWAPLRDDDSIFVSVAAYRDEICPATLRELFSHADNPDGVRVGLVQQNCERDCRTGVLNGGRVEKAPADVDCEKAFCESVVGRPFCEKGYVRTLSIREEESLGPPGARYLASKLWFGETYFMQIDAHMQFARGWDTDLIQDIASAPTRRAVLSHYPPSAVQKAEAARRWPSQGPMHMCGAGFSTAAIEHGIVRIDACRAFGRTPLQKPLYTPFVAAGFFFAPSELLAEVPFDPFMPYLFMGEELMLSLRFYTAGWDIFSPSRNVLAHYYVRRHKPKFWESVGRLFRAPAFHNRFTATMINRPKHIAGYPESRKVTPPSLLDRLDLYGLGKVRTAAQFMEVVGLDPSARVAKKLVWCSKGRPPPYVMPPDAGRAAYSGREAQLRAY